jgi:hypothetical protein
MIAAALPDRESCNGLGGHSRLNTRAKTWRRGSESNRRIKVLQTSPLPLGYRALMYAGGCATIERWVCGAPLVQFLNRFMLLQAKFSRISQTEEPMERPEGAAGQTTLKPIPTNFELKTDPEEHP